MEQTLANHPCEGGAPSARDPAWDGHFPTERGHLGLLAGSDLGPASGFTCPALRASPVGGLAVVGEQQPQAEAVVAAAGQMIVKDGVVGGGTVH